MDSLEACDQIEICNHSYTHAHLKYSSYYSLPDSVVEDFERSADSLHFKNNIARTPGRNIWRTTNITSTDIRNSSAAADSLKNKNFTLIGWDVEWHFDDKQFKLVQTADSLLNQIDSAFTKNKTKTAGHLVLLAHDQAFDDDADSTSLSIFLNKLKRKEDVELQFISKYPK